MEGMTPGRIVHYAAEQRGDFTACIPLIVGEVHSPTVVSGKSIACGGDEWVSSVTEAGANVWSDAEGGPDTPHTFHDPRGCVVHNVDVVDQMEKMAADRRSG